VTFRLHIPCSPLTRKRLEQFRKNRRAWWALMALAGIYAISLAAPLISPCSPDAIMSSAHFEPYRQITLTLVPPDESGRFNLTSDGRVTRPEGCAPFFPGVTSLAGEPLARYWNIPPELADAIAARFANHAAPACAVKAKSCFSSVADAVFTLAEYEPRTDPPSSVRLALRPVVGAQSRMTFQAQHEKQDRMTVRPERVWEKLSLETQRVLGACLAQAWAEGAADASVMVSGVACHARAMCSDVAWPHRPVPGHWMGIDVAGRDVLARVLYGLRASLTFGLLLVAWAMLLGVIIGAVQGYFGGWLDITVQRLIEIWSALPFLYIMILIGAVLGRSFLLLLICYGLFNWIGLSYYMRAEFLRLRSRSFVEAARCQGLGHGRIIFRHLLPNALTPVLTLFPFELVGAIAVLTALDFLGFGLPPLTPSLGELLQQAQQNRSAWWLVVYPAMTLFVVMLLTVLVGEGLRDAFDPKPKTQMEG